MTPYYDQDGITIYVGDNREVLPALDVTVSAVVTDPPYGLSFMGKDWDHSVPGEAFWRIIADAMKPGAHLLSFGGSRTFHRIGVAIEDAGLELRDTLMWLYGSGMPKSHNLSGDWAGWGTALKPAHEPVILARKRLSGTVAANVLAHGTGALNIDASRIGTEDNTSRPPGKPEAEGWGLHKRTEPSQSHPAGRWPANVILDEDAAAALDAQSGVRGGSKGGTSRGDKGMLSPETQRAQGYRPHWERTGEHDGGVRTGYGDTGGASRFFKVVAQDDLPINQPGASRMAYHAKASRKERNAGLENRVKLRDDLTPEQRAWVLTELEAAGVAT